MTSRLIPPGDSASLARAVLELLDRPDDIVRFGALARERAEAGFDVEKTNARMEQVLEDAVG